MKVIIAGGRHFKPSVASGLIISEIFMSNNITEIVSGGAKGADAYGESIAEIEKIPLKVFKADWKAYGKSAGPMRNKEMALYADAVILFKGGYGTANMRKHAIEQGLKILYDEEKEVENG